MGTRTANTQVGSSLLGRPLAIVDSTCERALSKIDLK
jgi:hypothetical protein